MLVNDTNLEVGLLLETAQLARHETRFVTDQNGVSHVYEVELGFRTAPLSRADILDFLALYLANSAGEKVQGHGLMSVKRYEHIAAHLCVTEVDDFISAVNENLLQLVVLSGTVCVDDMLVRYLGHTDVAVMIPRKPAKIGLLGHGLSTYLRYTRLPFLLQYLGYTKRKNYTTPGDAVLRLARKLSIDRVRSFFVLDSGYGTFDLLRNLARYDHQVLCACSSTNMRGLDSLLTLGLGDSQWRVFEGQYEGVRFLAYGYQIDKSKRNLYSLSTAHAVHGESSSAYAADGTAAGSRGDPAFDGRDVAKLSTLRRTALMDLASRVGVDVSGDATTLAYKIAQYAEPEEEPARRGGAGPTNGTGQIAPSVDVNSPDFIRTCFAEYKVQSLKELVDLEVGDRVAVVFDDYAQAFAGTVSDIAPDYVSPYGISFPGDAELFWVSLTWNVAKLSEDGHIVACTTTVSGALSQVPGPGAAQPAGAKSAQDDSESSHVIANLQRKTVPQILQLLQQIDIVPRSSEKRKGQLVELYVREKRRLALASPDLMGDLKTFLSPVGSGTEPPVHSDYAHFMGLVDRIDQAHSDAWPHHRVLGGSDRSFVLHLLTFLFLNARAAHADLSSDGAHRAPGAVRGYVDRLLQSRLKRREK
jgi:hypothetical protein